MASKDIKVVVTHPGIHHADDAFAVALLYLDLGKMAFSVERRVPTPEDLADPQVAVVDVGGVFDPELHNYDHHQKGGAGTRKSVIVNGYECYEKDGGPYASAGLVWNFSGAAEMLFERLFGRVSEFQTEFPAWKARVDLMLFRGVDASDCGKSKPAALGDSPNISQVISWMNGGPGASTEDRWQAFLVARGVACDVIIATAMAAWEWVTAKQTVMTAPVSDRIMTLPTFVMWNEHIFARPDHEDILYVVFPAVRGGFAVQQVPLNPESFEGRKPLPEAWAGCTGNALAEICGVSDADFCHAGRFFASAKTLEGALEMARIAVAS